MVLPSSSVEEELNNSDRDALIAYQNNVSSMPNETQCISLNEILQPNDEMVFVRGVAGSGKTTMIDMLALKWAKCELGKAFSDVDFLFKFNCRELNNLLHRGLTLESLFVETYPEIFSEISLRELIDLSERVLIMVDGLDELSDVYKMGSNHEKDDLLQVVFQLMSPKQKPFLKNHKTIVSGRPKACEFVRAQFSRRNIKTNIIQVCGFNSLNVERYIENFFNYEDSYKAKRVSIIVNHSIDLRVMASIPVFLWVICTVFSEDLIGKPLDSNVELYFYACLILLRNHFNRNSSSPYKSLYEVVKDLSVTKQLYSVMVLSAKTYMQNRVLFTDEEIKNLPYHLEQTGFIVKYSRGNLKKPTYQFKHLIIQEFLCAMYLSITKDIGRYKSNRELSSCLPTIVGIHRLIEENTNELFITFYNELEKIKEPASHFTRWLAERKYYSYIRTHNIDLQNNTIVIPGSMIRGTQLVILADFETDFMKILQQKNISVVSPSILKSASIRYFGFSGSHLQIIRKLIYFLNIQKIDDLYLKFVLYNDDDLNSDIIDIIRLTTTKKKTIISIGFSTVISNISFKDDSPFLELNTNDLIISNKAEFDVTYEYLNKLIDRTERYIITIDASEKEKRDMELEKNVILKAVELGKVHQIKTLIIIETDFEFYKDLLKEYSLVKIATVLSG